MRERRFAAGEMYTARDLAAKVQPETWQLRWDRGMAYLYGRLGQVASFRIATADESEFVLMAVQGFVPALEEIERLRTDLVGMTENAQATINGMLEKNRALNREVERLREIERKYLEISGVISEKLGDAGYLGPADEEEDTPEQFAIKRIFEIFDGEEPEGSAA